jgi:hypothetical protein
VTRKKQPPLDIKPIGVPHAASGSGIVWKLSDLGAGATEVFFMKGTAGSAAPGKGQLAHTVVNFLEDIIIDGGPIPSDKSVLGLLRHRLMREVSPETLKAAKEVAGLTHKREPKA